MTPKLCAGGMRCDASWGFALLAIYIYIHINACMQIYIIYKCNEKERVHGKGITNGGDVMKRMDQRKEGTKSRKNYK